MYFTYDINQSEILPSGDVVEKRDYVTFERNISASHSRFKPRHLLRITDMCIVEGAEVDEQYWALSYAYSQSAIIPQWTNGKYRRIAAYTHQVVAYPKGVPEKFWVTFYLLIQQICTDFGIRYLWFDQMCIDPTDESDRMDHFREVHMIYRHALCTVALVPELRRQKDCSDSYLKFIVNSEWSKRAWTLPEMYHSCNILFLGQDVHLWKRGNHAQAAPYDSKTEHFLRNLFYRPSEDWSANTILWFSQHRTSSQPHDRIYALINMCPSIIQQFRFSYDENMYDLTIQFYRLLVMHDPSVLLFGWSGDDNEVGEEWADEESDDDERLLKWKHESLLPTWTGVGGTHIPQTLKGSLMQRTNLPKCTVERHFLRVKSVCTEARLDQRISYNNIRQGLPSRPINMGLAPLDFVESSDLPVGFETEIHIFGLEPTHFLPVWEKEFECFNDVFAPSHIVGYLSLTKSHYSSHCLILADLCFALDDVWHAYPVVETSNYDSSTYKSVGVCLLKGFQLYPVKQNARELNIE